MASVAIASHIDEITAQPNDRFVLPFQIQLKGDGGQTALDAAVVALIIIIIVASLAIVIARPAHGCGRANQDQNDRSEVTSANAGNLNFVMVVTLLSWMLPCRHFRTKTVESAETFLR